MLHTKTVRGASASIFNFCFDTNMTYILYIRTKVKAKKVINSFPRQTNKEVVELRDLLAKED